MTTHFRLNPDRLVQLATDLEAVYSDDLRGVVLGLRRVEAGLSEAWVGPSYEAFGALHGGWIGRLEAIGQDLPRVAAFLRAAADEYRRLDAERRAAVPGFRPGSGSAGLPSQASGRGAWSEPPPEQNMGWAFKVRILPPLVDAAQAQQIYDAMRTASWDADPEPDIPWGYTLDGCYARAAKMDELMQTQFDVSPWKVWAFVVSGDLRLNPGKPTEYDERYSAHGRETSQPANWVYHVAPVVRVPKPDGSRGYDWVVIDPSIATGPVTVRVWRDLMRTNGLLAEDINLRITPPGRAPQYRAAGVSGTGSGYWPGADPAIGVDAHRDWTLEYYSFCDENDLICERDRNGNPGYVDPITGKFITYPLP